MTRKCNDYNGKYVEYFVTEKALPFINNEHGDQLIQKTIAIIEANEFDVSGVVYHHSFRVFNMRVIVSITEADEQSDTWYFGKIQLWVETPDRIKEKLVNK